jgi:hypothetical protein
LGDQVTATPTTPCASASSIGRSAMSAALRAYAAREAATRSAEQQQQQQAAADAGAEEQAPFVGKRVQISGLLARPDLNGQVGNVTSFSSATARYVVSVGGESIALRATNLTVAKSDSSNADAFSVATRRLTPWTSTPPIANLVFGPLRGQEGSRVKLKGLTAKPELNGCGATVVEWNEEKERFAVELDGSLQRMLLRAANLERDRRERWAPEMHTTANLAHIQAEQERYYQEQAANANPFVGMVSADRAPHPRLPRSRAHALACRVPAPRCAVALASRAARRSTVWQGRRRSADEGSGAAECGARARRGGGVTRKAPRRRHVLL